MVIGLWALVLLPTWLRSHEQVDEGKQVDKFQLAMSKLSMSGVELLESSPHKQVQVKHAIRAGVEPSTRLSAAARRRRVLAILGAIQFLGLLTVLMGGSLLAALIPAMLIGTFLTLARSQVRVERARRETAPVTAHESSVLASTITRTLAGARTARRTTTHPVASVEQAPAAPTVDVPAAWQPVRTPAPSYVLAPAATAVPRAIDAAGGWTGSSMVNAAAAARTASADAARAMAVQGEDVETLAPTAAARVSDDTAELPVIRITA